MYSDDPERPSTRRKAGDTVKVKTGTYREGVKVIGASRSATCKLIGNPKDPTKVLLDGTQGKKVPRQNGVRVNGADEVTINGFTAKHYKATASSSSTSPATR